MSESGEIYTAGKSFTLPPAVTAVTNSTSALIRWFWSHCYQPTNQEELAKGYPNLFRLLWQSTLPCYPPTSEFESSDSVHMLRKCSWQGEEVDFLGIINDFYCFCYCFSYSLYRRWTALLFSPQWSLTRVFVARSTWTWLWNNQPTVNLWLKCR